MSGLTQVLLKRFMDVESPKIKFRIRNYAGGKEINFGELNLREETIQSLQDPQLTALLNGEEVTVFKNLSQPGTNSGSNIKKWLQVCNFEKPHIDYNSRYLVVNVRTNLDKDFIYGTLGQKNISIFDVPEGGTLQKCVEQHPDCINKTYRTVKSVDSYEDALDFIKKYQESKVPTQGPQKTAVNLLYLDRLDDKNKSLKLLQPYDRFLADDRLETLQIITSCPGNGKTTLLRDWYENFYELCRKDSIPVFATATELLLNVTLSEDGSCTTDEVKLAIAKILQTTEFEKLLALDLLEKRHFTIFIDAVDEVPNPDMKAIVNILEAFRNASNLRIIATCRSHMSAGIKWRFKLDSIYELQHLTFSELHKIIVRKRCDSKIPIEEAESPCDSKITTEEAERILNIFRKNVMRKKKFRYTPLFVEMVAEMSAHNNIEAYTLTVIYKEFMDANYDRYVNSRIWNQDKPQLSLEQYLEAHMNLAVKQLLKTNDNILVERTDYTPGQWLIISIDPPVFSHYTFAEYFADLLCYKVLFGEIPLRSEVNTKFSELVETRIEANKHPNGPFAFNFLLNMLLTHGKEINYDVLKAPPTIREELRMLLNPASYSRDPKRIKQN